MHFSFSKRSALQAAIWAPMGLVNTRVREWDPTPQVWLQSVQGLQSVTWTTTTSNFLKRTTFNCSQLYPYNYAMNGNKRAKIYPNTVSISTRYLRIKFENLDFAENHQS